MNKIILPSVFVILVNFNLNGQSKQIEAYIDKYKDIAIVEMYRTGIPASIKLAQAILESQAGESFLSVESNNHFGIKCGGGWEGPTFLKRDDDFDEEGNLINSCFRVFENPEESFIAHSTFLLDPAKEHRYGFLFNLPPHDYKSWAWGLKRSGYATNPHYAKLLINIIEDHKLHALDYAVPDRRTFAENGIERYENMNPGLKTDRMDDLSSNNRIHVSNSGRIITNNKSRLIFAMEGDIPGDISERYGVPVRKIVKYNEGIDDSEQKLTRGEYVYLEKKKSRLTSGKKTHRVEPGETMYSIAQRYGIQLTKLTVRNRLYPGEEPLPGEIIVLKGLIKVKHRPKIRREILKVDELAENPEQKYVPVKEQSTPKTIIAPNIHIVETGDTLFNIARKHRVTVQMLQEWNNLENSVIKPGQEIIVNP
jgi:LysM repeat protein